ncbi:hypothetical protein [Pseudorhizobium pelagicum]|uniref:Uncharacterized protein n=1 Tax=Pseudorhizobium pelagicum TaxID=1509405 RepID=A0A922P076_9HYPH|nr:hypothetical protein [Pseudorhizobium pelagicum]KEQ08961.1 hypothetical protein GV67_10660 [Pseudorhizobium pelagicum]KEQ09952.1 hypothetical protein GV68_21680 [Pseudorhizobium pelagicum]
MALMATKITIADLFPDDQGMILVAKDAVDGLPRHISEVANGKPCGCICFGCERPMVARNGGAVRAHHFAHRPEDMVYDCTTAGETALHERAKEIIAKHRRVTLPATSVPGLDGKPVEVTPERSIDLTDVRLEVGAGEVVPDVTATMPDGRRIFIEIANTHPCPREKIAKLVAMGVEVLEITVRVYRETPLAELDDIILDLAPREFLYSSERAAKADEIAEERRRMEEKEFQEAERLVGIYREPPTASHGRAAELVEEMSLWDLEGFMDADDTLPSAFIVPRRQWQAAVFYRLMSTQYPETVSPIDMVNRFKEREWTKRDLVYITNEQSRKIAADHDANFRSANEEILAYMRRLEKGDIVYQRPGKTFYVTVDFKKRLKAILEALNEADASREAVEEAYKAIDALVKPGGGRMPDFDEWLQQHADRLGVGVREFLADDDLVYQTEESLNEIGQVIEKRVGGEWEELPEDLMGLPMVGLVNRLMQAWDDVHASDGYDWRALIK